MKPARAHVLVRGRVQGVFFRESLRRRAEQLSVSGWARNLPDGRVEAVLEGDRPDVEAVLLYVREGPGLARVDGVELVDEAYRGDRPGFEVL